MGYPIRSDIFKPNSEVYAHFRRFPVQIAILFSPYDRSFAEHLERRFQSLHQTTGTNLVFFALLDPPTDWLNDRRNRQWWDGYKRTSGTLSYSFDDRVLLGELVRLFGLTWDDLPTLVVSTNLWEDDFVTCPTSAELLDEQLLKLTQLVEREGWPTVAVILETLHTDDDLPVRLHRQTDAAKERLSNYYEILCKYGPGQDSDPMGYRNLLQSELVAVETELRALRTRHAEQRPEKNPEDAMLAEEADAAIEAAAGRLVPLASVARRQGHEFGHHDLPDLLDDASKAMLFTAMRVGSFLETLPFDEWLPGIAVDFTPGAQGAWKAFEREVNLSAIQAARNWLGIPMPEFYARYFDKDTRSFIMQTGSRPANLNERDNEHGSGDRHKFIMLGPSYWGIKRLLTEEPQGGLLSFIEAKLGKPFPVETLQEWQKIYRIRNPASHTDQLTRQQYHGVIQAVVDSNVLEPLLQLKTALRDGYNIG